MQHLLIQKTHLSGLVVIQRQELFDTRGYFSRLYCADELLSIGLTLHIAQINQTFTKRKGTVRGLHFQRHPHSEDKIVSVIRGEVFDVAVDLRRDSPTYLNWYGELLSEGNKKSLLVPRGFAHGFQTLADNCELIYLHTYPYVPESEDGLRADDPSLSISWPLTISEISDRDLRFPLLNLPKEDSNI